MSTFSEDILVDAPVEKVWECLADIGAIDQWNPGVHDSHLTSDAEDGEGTARYCDLGGSNYLYERVVKWDERSALTMRITKTNLPFHKADIHFKLKTENNGTLVIVSPDYVLKYGVVGRVLDRFYIKGKYRKGMVALLAGLKEYIESNDAGKTFSED